MTAVHFFAFDPRFCGEPPAGTTRRVSPTREGVTCPDCLRQNDDILVIDYKGEHVGVRVILVDELDDDMPLLVWFPEHHPMYLPDGVWLSANDFQVVE